MKKWLGFFGALLFSGVAIAQTTTVVGVATDSDGTLWTNGTVSVQFVPNPSQSNLNAYRINGAPLSSAVTMQGPISLGNSGSFSVTVYDNTQVTPSGSQWQFTVCPNAISKCGSVTTSVTGVSQNITTAVDAAIPAPRFLAVAGSYGYTDVESILSTSVGGTYWNVTDLCQRYYNGSTWNCGSGGGGLSVTATPPVLVNGGAGPVSSGTADISCPGCGGGGAVSSVNGQTGAVTLPKLTPRIDYVLGDSRNTVSSTCQFSGTGVAAVTAASVSGGIITVTQKNNQVAGNILVLEGWTGAYASLNGQVVTVLSTGLSASQWEASLSLVPPMTSDIQPSGTVSSSSQYTYGGRADWWAFNSTTTGWLANASTGWLQYQFPTAATVNNYYITPFSDTFYFPNESPTAWTLQGSNNGSTWTVIDTRTVLSSSWTSNTPVSFSVASPGSYTYYRLNITADGGSGTTGIAYLSLSSVPDGTPAISGVANICRNILPTQLAYSPLYQSSGVPVVNLAQPGYTLIQAVTDYPTVYHPLTQEGHPVNFILNFAQDAASCEAAGAIETAFQTFWADAWADGATVTTDTMTPYGLDYYCDADAITAQTNKFLLSQTQILNSHNSLLVDVASQVNDPSDSYYYQQSFDAHHGTDAFASLLAGLIENAEASNTNYISRPSQGIIAATPGGSYLAVYDPTTGDNGFLQYSNNGGADDWTLGTISDTSPSTRISTFTLHPSSNPYVTAFIPGGIFSGASQGAFCIGSACLNWDNSTTPGYFSADDTTPYDHALSMWVHNLRLDAQKASSGEECLQIDSSGNVTNTGSACGGGGGTGFNGGAGTSYQDALEIAAPANPASTYDRLYLDSTAHQLKCLTSSGGSCMPSGGGTVTTSGSPVSPNIAAFSGSTAITAATSANIQTAIGASVYDAYGAAAARQANLSLLPGTYTDGDMCIYTASGTLLNCNTAIPSVGTWGALNYPTWASGTPFVKMTAAGTFALDTNIYLTSLPATVVQTNQSNSFGAYLQDFSNATQIKLPTASGYTSAANGEIGYDSAGNNWHGWLNGADMFLGLIPKTGITNNHCVQFAIAGGVVSLSDAGGTCTTGGSMVWPTTAGIVYWTSGTGWGGAYNASTPIPANYLPTNLSSSSSVNGTSIPASATLCIVSSLCAGYQAALTDPVTGPGSGVTVGHIAVFGNTSGTTVTDGGPVPTGSGTVSSGTEGQIAWYDATGTEVEGGGAGVINSLLQGGTGCNTAGYVYSPQSGTCAAPGSGVPNVNGITGAVTIAAGAGISVGTIGSTVTITNTGGGTTPGVPTVTFLNGTAGTLSTGYTDFSGTITFTTGVTNPNDIFSLTFGGTYSTPLSCGAQVNEPFVSSAQRQIYATTNPASTSVNFVSYTTNPLTLNALDVGNKVSWWCIPTGVISGGGGGGGFSPWPSSLSQPISTNFTTHNFSASTVADKTGRMVLTTTGATMGTLISNTALPSPPYTVDLACTEAAPSGVYSFCNIILENSGSGNLIAFGSGLASSAPSYQANDWSSYTSYAGGTSCSTGSNASALYLLGTNLFFERVTNDATTVTYWVSNNGKDYFNVCTQPVGTYMTPDTVGIGISTTGGPVIDSIYNYAVTNSVLPQFAP